MPASDFFKVTLLLWAASILPVQGQIHATCTNSSFAWSYNSRGDTPCEIGEALGGVCRPSFNIQPLPEGFYYSGVSGVAVTPCVCNTVYYTMLSVCGLCQGGSADKFNLWSVNCTRTYSSTFPSPLPSGLRVPHYAYLPLDPLNQTVDLRALQLDTGPERTGTASTRTTSSSRSTSTFRSGGGDDFDPFGDFDSDLREAAKKAGIIAGCVVAAIWVVWAIGAGLLWWILRRQSRRMYGAPSQMYQNSMAGANGGTYAPVPPNSPPPTGGAFPQAPPSPGMLNEKVYNPNDPSTFPQTQLAALGYQQPYGMPPADRTSAVVSTASFPTTPTTYTSPDRNSITTPPTGAQYAVPPPPPPPGAMQNPYQAVTMPVVSYSTGGSNGSNGGNNYPSDQHRQAYTSGLPQI